MFEGGSDFFEIEFRAAANLVRGEPSLVHFEGELNLGALGRDRALVVGVQGIDFPKDAVGSEESDIERDGSVRHVKTRLPGKTEDEKHAVVLVELIPEHKSARGLFLGDGEFDMNGLFAKSQGKSVVCGQRFGFLNLCAPCGKQRAGEQPEKGGADKAFPDCREG